ncbi:hypothetical protein J601_3854, partial [Acinetobacter baumannii 831240]
MQLVLVEAFGLFLRSLHAKTMLHEVSEVYV